MYCCGSLIEPDKIFIDHHEIFHSIVTGGIEIVKIHAGSIHRYSLRCVGLD
jgi:hypothetical protein